MSSYCEAADVTRACLGVAIDSYTASLSALIAAESEEFERRTGRQYKVTGPVTELYNGTGTRTLLLKNYPVISITSLSVPLYWGDLTFTDADLSIERESGEVMFPLRVPFPESYPLDPFTADLAYPRFPVGLQNVSVTYTYGFATVPTDIRDAVAKMVAIRVLLAKGAELTDGLTGVSIGPFNQQYQQKPFGLIIDRYTEDVERVITRYRKIGGAR